MDRDYSRLEKNIFDMITEQQLKLGYMREAVRLYYLDKPMARLLGLDVTSDRKLVLNELSNFCKYEEDRMGCISYQAEEGRYCLVFSPEVSEYVHNNLEDQTFLIELIEAVASHKKLDEVFEVFRNHSEHVHIEDVREKKMDFDYLLYFEDGIPDDMNYCITDEGCHVTYHRYMKEDYAEIFG